MPSLSALLAERSVLLADGATGTNYFDAGLQSGDPPELWNIDHPDRVADLHRRFVTAGADIILTNTFGGNARRLRLHALDGRVHELNAAAARIARDVADESGRTVIVAGSVGPTGDLFEPLGEMTPELAIATFKEQMTGLADGGADVMWIETMSASEEIQAAVTAARDLDLPYCFTASFDTAGRTMMGLDPAALPEVVNGEGPAPIALGANCGVGASDMLLAILAMTAAAPERVVVAKANCGIPQVKGGDVVYTGTPALMADFCRMAIDSGARIIGGCCGTTPAHLAEMRAAIDAHVRGERPSEAEIVERIGPIMAPAAQVDAGDGGSEGRGRRGRRRARA